MKPYYYAKLCRPWLYKPIDYSSRERVYSQVYQKKMRDSCMAKINQKYLPKKLFICSGYFEPECFKRDLKVRLDFSLKNYFSHFHEKGYQNGPYMNRLFCQENYKVWYWMVFIFHFKGELLRIKSWIELKENAIPTLFDHAPLPKK